MDSEQAQAPDWLDRLVDKMYERMEEGERPALSFLLEEFLNKFMERERRRFLKDHEGEGEQANGFYSTPAPSASPSATSTSRSPGSAMPSPSAPRSSPRAGSGWTRITRSCSSPCWPMVTPGLNWNGL